MTIYFLNAIECPGCMVMTSLNRNALICSDEMLYTNFCQVIHSKILPPFKQSPAHPQFGEDSKKL